MVQLSDLEDIVMIAHVDGLLICKRHRVQVRNEIHDRIPRNHSLHKVDS